MRRMIFVVAGVVVLLLSAAGAFWLFRTMPEGKSPASTQASEAGSKLPLSIRVRPFGAYSGRLFDLSPDPARPPDSPEVYGHEDLPKGGNGREPVDSILVDVTLRGAAGSHLVDAGFDLRVYVVPDKPAADAADGGRQLILERILEDVEFGPQGTHHEAVFVIGHACQKLAIEAEIAKPSYFSAKTTLPFVCGR